MILSCTNCGRKRDYSPSGVKGLRKPYRCLSCTKKGNKFWKKSSAANPRGNNSEAAS